jgi:hypothetical protein
MAMMAITTSNSIKVNPTWVLGLICGATQLPTAVGLYIGSLLHIMVILQINPLPAECHAQNGPIFHHDFSIGRAPKAQGRAFSALPPALPAASDKTRLKAGQPAGEMGLAPLRLPETYTLVVQDAITNACVTNGRRFVDNRPQWHAMQFEPKNPRSTKGRTGFPAPAKSIKNHQPHPL